MRPHRPSRSSATWTPSARASGNARLSRTATGKILLWLALSPSFNCIVAVLTLTPTPFLNHSRERLGIPEDKPERPAGTTKEDEEWWATKTRTGGTYLPPARLAAMQKNITDQSSKEYQRMTWEALKKSINGLINKVGCCRENAREGGLWRENAREGGLWRENAQERVGACGCGERKREGGRGRLWREKTRGRAGVCGCGERKRERGRARSGGVRHQSGPEGGVRGAAVRQPRCQVHLASAATSRPPGPLLSASDRWEASE